MERQAVQAEKQLPEARRCNFNEVSFGYTADQTISEASRCLQCNDAPCSSMCPVGIDIPRFIHAISKGKFDEAIRVIKEKNSLPCVTGRVCPQEVQCQ